MEGNCELCGRWRNLHRHHIFFGRGKRQISERYGATIMLCPVCHSTDRKQGIHGNHWICLQVQEQEQRRLMKKYNWTVQDFVNRFYKNYI